MSVDETEVRRIVTATLTKHSSGGCCDQVCAAWKELYDTRNFASHRYGKIEIAIAEHYLYARCKVCSGEYSKTQMEAMVKGYNAVKRVGFSELLRSNPDNPTTPPSDEAIRWGLKGAEEGERDRISCNPKAIPPTFTVPLFLKKKTGYKY